MRRHKSREHCGAWEKNQAPTFSKGETGIFLAYFYIRTGINFEKKKKKKKTEKAQEESRGLF